LVLHENIGHLVTAKHLARAVGDNPFLIRINRKDGTSETLPQDNIKWVEHPSADVDVDAIVFSIPANSPYDILYLKEFFPSDRVANQVDDIGVGDFTYTVGLFRFMHGRKRNTPIRSFWFNCYAAQRRVDPRP